MLNIYFHGYCEAYYHDYCKYYGIEMNYSKCSQKQFTHYISMGEVCLLPVWKN